MRWCTISCLGSTDWCSPNSGQVLGAAIRPDDLASLRQQLQDALAELEDYEAATKPKEPETAAEIEEAEKQLTEALAALAHQKSKLPK